MKLRRVGLIIILNILPTLGNAETTYDDWKKEIQLRMDYSNPQTNRAICLIYSYGGNEPYMKMDKRDNSLVDLSPYALFNESVWIYPTVLRTNEVFYQYDISEYGKRYRVTWPNMKDMLGFCFGNLTVESIIEVKDLSVTYQYKIDSVPEWAETLLSRYFSHPLNQLQQAKAEFAYNDNHELISLSKNFSYYIEADSLASNDSLLVSRQIK